MACSKSVLPRSFYTHDTPTVAGELLAKHLVRCVGDAELVGMIVEGSLTDLSTFSDETFDAVLCLGGPLSHL